MASIVPNIGGLFLEFDGRSFRDAGGEVILTVNPYNPLAKAVFANIEQGVKIELRWRPTESPERLREQAGALQKQIDRLVDQRVEILKRL